MNGLPAAFLLRMQQMLKDEYPHFEEGLLQKPLRGIRVNTLKCPAERFLQKSPFPLTPSPFAKDSFYVPPEQEGLGLHPYHHAGVYYVQEPSASCAVTALEVQPGDRVLDLCAAPGGKSTQIAAALKGQGLLWSNEAVKSRTGALLSNLERIGAANAVISSAYPSELCGRLSGFFDRVLVDAPCSGEGMFRKEPAAVEHWSEANVKACAERQLSILNDAAGCLRAGGRLVYSTCTFSREENEGVVEAFLRENPEFELVSIQADFGRAAFEPCAQARRIFPMDGGEGHFAAAFYKKDGNGEIPAEYAYPSDFAGRDEAVKLWHELFEGELPGVPARFGDTVYLLPEGLPRLPGCVLRTGCAAFTVKKNRMEPCHQLYLTAGVRPRSVLSLSLGDRRVQAFLRGEEIEAEEGLKGFTAVQADGFTLGFGKCSGGVLKNRYPKGLRNLT
ncbi:MAG: hypothetical protein HFE85_00745 [Clostridiales bacterium]|nr:hypothetical protein [Clostridiales bacterium]